MGHRFRNAASLEYTTQGRENHMGKKMENEMEVGVTYKVEGFRKSGVSLWIPF